MNNLKELLVKEISNAFSQIIKDDKIIASEEIADVLINEGFIQHKINDVYKSHGIIQEVTIMRLNKQVGRIYSENSSSINEFLQMSRIEGIPDYPMNKWLSELIEEDLCTGVAPFANTKENIKKIHDIVLEYDPLFNAIANELRNVYSYIEEQKLIEPISFIQKSIEVLPEEDKPEVDEVTYEEISGNKLISTPSENEKGEEEYVENPFNIVVG